MAATGASAPETKTFLENRNKIVEQGCCHSKHTRNCCFASGIIGAITLVLGLVVIIAGEGAISGLILKSMALKPGSDRLQSWLTPPVQPRLTGYAFHVSNPDEVVAGMKPKLVEVGPFVYKSITVKDSRDNLQYNEDGETLKYSPRKFYYFEPSLSVGNPDTTYITVPNIPLITALSSLKGKSGFGKNVAMDLILNEGLGTPFINVSFSGLLWGYDDSLPCLKQPQPEHCPKPGGVSFDSSDPFADDEEGDDWMDGEDDDWKRKKRSVADESHAKRTKRSASSPSAGDDDLRNGDFESWEKPKGGFVNCTCNWGLFRDRNVTLREPVRMHHGMSVLGKKGWVKEFNSKPVMNWWKEGSKCDEIGGQDGGTFPPGKQKEDELDIFISLMCRRINLVYERDEKYMEDLTALRFVPPPNAMGSHKDEDPIRRNPDNECYCLEEEGFKCFKSGVLNMAPCKRTSDRPEGAPLALSYPHFYQAHPDILNAVEGLEPDKEKHQFYVDLSPEFGFPLAIRPRFQLNILMQRDEDIPILSKLPEELILPFLWAQDGFDQPSEEMAKAIRKGLDAPSKLSMLLGLFLLALGAGLILSALLWTLWRRRTSTGAELISRY